MMTVVDKICELGVENGWGLAMFEPTATKYVFYKGATRACFKLSDPKNVNFVVTLSETDEWRDFTEVDLSPEDFLYFSKAVELMKEEYMLRKPELEVV